MRKSPSRRKFWAIREREREREGRWKGLHCLWPSLAPGTTSDLIEMKVAHDFHEDLCDWWEYLPMVLLSPGDKVRWVAGVKWEAFLCSERDSLWPGGIVRIVMCFLLLLACKGLVSAFMKGSVSEQGYTWVDLLFIFVSDKQLRVERVKGQGALLYSSCYGESLCAVSFLMETLPQFLCLA